MSLSIFATCYEITLLFLGILLTLYWSEAGFRDLSGYKLAMNHKRIAQCITSILMMGTAWCALFLGPPLYGIIDAVLIVLVAVFGVVLFFVSIAHRPASGQMS